MRRSVLDDRKLEVLRAIVEDFVSTTEPVGSKALAERHSLGRQPGHRPQRHGRARGGGLHHPPAHQRRPHPDRQGLPAVRRPAVDGQAAVAGRAAGHPVASSRARSTSTTSCAARCGCSPSSPARSRSCSTRRCRAAPCATSRSSTSRRTGCCSCSSPTPAGSSSACSSCPSTLSDDDVAVLRQVFGSRAARRPPRRRAGRAVRPARRRAAGDPPGAHQRHDGGPRDAGRAARGAHRAGGHGQPHPARRSTSRRPSARCSRRSRSRSCCSSCSARSTTPRPCTSRSARRTTWRDSGPPPW